MGKAVQTTAAAILGRGFLPLGALALTGLIQGLRGTLSVSEAVLLVVGSVLAAATMLAYGQLAVHKAFGRPKRPWTVAASLGGMFPYVFGVYVVVGLGLAPLRDGFGLGRALATLFFVSTGAWCLRTQWRLSDLHLLVASVDDLTGPTDASGVADG